MAGLGRTLGIKSQRRPRTKQAIDGSVDTIEDAIRELLDDMVDCFTEAVEQCIGEKLAILRDFEELLMSEEYVECMDDCIPDIPKYSDYIRCYFECLLLAEGEWHGWYMFFKYIEGNTILLNAHCICLEYSICMEIEYPTLGEDHMGCCNNAMSTTLDDGLTIEEFAQLLADCEVNERFPERPGTIPEPELLGSSKLSIGGLL